MEIPMRRLLIAAGLCLSVASPAMACNNYDDTLKRAQYARDTSKPDDQAKVLILDGEVLETLLRVIRGVFMVEMTADKAVVLQWREGAFLALSNGGCVRQIHQIPADAWRQLMDMTLGKPEGEQAPKPGFQRLRSA
jgi:hypothetical protein